MIKKMVRLPSFLLYLGYMERNCLTCKKCFLSKSVSGLFRHFCKVDDEIEVVINKPAYHCCDEYDHDKKKFEYEKNRKKPKH